MLLALGHLLPLAVALALSSVPIMATIAVLLSPKRNRAALPFLIGSVLGLALVVTLCVIFARAVPPAPPRQPQVGLAIGLVIVGTALIVFALIRWRRASATTTGDTPKWLRAVGSMGALPSFGLAVSLNFRPKALLIGAAAGLTLRADALSVSTVVIVLAIYAAVALSTVAVPIIMTLAAPEKMEKQLLSSREWITRNSQIVTILIMIMVGVVVIGNGLSRF